MAFIFGLITENQKVSILPTEFWASHFKYMLIFQLHVAYPCYNGPLYDASQHV